jgi:flagellar biosynthesis protein FlhA
MATVQKVLQNLLRERVSIRDGASILEALGEAAAITRNPVLLTEFVRQAIRRTVAQPYLAPSGDLPAFLLDPTLEQAIESASEHGELTSHLNMSPMRIRDMIDRIAKKINSGDSNTVLLTSSGARHFLRQMIEGSLPNVSVIGHNEIPPGLRVVSLGAIE